MDNAALAARLEAWADALEHRGESAFRVRAYRRAAAQVALHGKSVAAMAKAGADLEEIPGVGPSIAARLLSMLEEGVVAAPAGPKKDAGPVEAARPLRRLRPPRPRTGLAAKLRGDLHAHTDATDGRDSLRAMVEAAKQRGLEYLAITDHSKDTRVAGGLPEEAMRRHLERIRRLDDEVEGITVLAGAEVDILRDGRLDYSDKLLADLDVVLCSVHFRHRLTGREQTQRILAGMSNDHADILTHPTGRRLGIRPPMDIDLGALAESARGQGWAIEMNGSPERLDLDGPAAAEVARQGVLLALNSDAHATRELDNVLHCSREAEKAGLGPRQILNCRTLEQLRKVLRS